MMILQTCLAWCRRSRNRLFFKSGLLPDSQNPHEAEFDESNVKVCAVPDVPPTTKEQPYAKRSANPSSNTIRPSSTLYGKNYFHTDRIEPAGLLRTQSEITAVDQQQRQEWGESQPQIVPKEVLEAQEKSN